MEHEIQSEIDNTINDLLPVSSSKFGDEEVNAVSARELHKFLQSKQEFATWIKNRIEKYGFLEEKDFLIILSKTQTQGRPTKEYYISIDMAKELAMVENNPQGRVARQYFIECEKKLRQVYSVKDKCFLDIIKATNQTETLLGLNALNNKVIVPLEQYKAEASAYIEQVKPKEQYYDRVLACTNTLPIKNIAADYGFSAQKMNKLLHEAGVQYKESGIWRLYAPHLAQGYARLETYVVNAGTQHQQVRQNLKWTQKGRLFIYETLKSKGILPVCEQN